MIEKLKWPGSIKESAMRIACRPIDYIDSCRTHHLPSKSSLKLINYATLRASLAISIIFLEGLTKLIEKNYYTGIYAFIFHTIIIYGLQFLCRSYIESKLIRLHLLKRIRTECQSRLRLLYILEVFF